MNITEFEERVIAQRQVGAGHYDEEYFTGDWRAEFEKLLAESHKTEKN